MNNCPFILSEPVIICHIFNFSIERERSEEKKNHIQKTNHFEKTITFTKKNIYKWHPFEIARKKKNLLRLSIGKMIVFNLTLSISFSLKLISNSGICRIFEEHLKRLHPNSPSITYDISELFDFIDNLTDLSCLMWVGLTWCKSYKIIFLFYFIINLKSDRMYMK